VPQVYTSSFHIDLTESIPLQYALVFFPGLLTGRLFDIGIFKIPYFIASVVLVAAVFLVAECKEYWQFLLCQGFAIGVCIFFFLGLGPFSLICILACLRNIVRSGYGYNRALVQEKTGLCSWYDCSWFVNWWDGYSYCCEETYCASWVSLTEYSLSNSG